MTTTMLLLLALATLDPQERQSPVIDGRIDETEWAGARHEKLTGGGAVHLLRRGDFLYVAVHGPDTGLASLCVAKGKTVRILHASAAIGEASFALWGDVWMKRKDFEWRLRDSRRAGPPDDEAKREVLSKARWVANASAAGSPEREFQIVATDAEFLGVTFLTIKPPLSVSYWPASMSDDCRTVRIPQGYLPDTARFEPLSWARVVN